MAGPSAWDQLCGDVDRFSAALVRYRAVNINSAELRAQARLLGQRFFREAKPELAYANVDQPTLDALGAQFQELIRLANGRNLRTSYGKALAAIRPLRTQADTQRELRYTAATPKVVVLTAIEKEILATLGKLVPSAGLSYAQAVSDLQGGERESWRGPAADLREALRESLDHLAPDPDVESAKGYKLEEGQKGPTMRQKVRHILRSRGVTAAAGDAPENAIAAIDEVFAGLARSTYVRGSMTGEGRD